MNEKAKEKGQNATFSTVIVCVLTFWAHYFKGFWIRLETAEDDDDEGGFAP